jgi:Protein of unknown function (DUF2842)
MRQRTRKLIGTVLLLVLVVFWALFVTSLGAGRLARLSADAQAALFVVLGLVWVLADPLDVAAGRRTIIMPRRPA